MRSDNYKRSQLIQEIVDKLVDQDLVKSVDYPNIKNSYEDVYDIISDCLKDYQIIEGEAF